MATLTLGSAIGLNMTHNASFYADSVLFEDIKQCAYINCTENWAKTRALRNTILQVKLIIYSSPNRDSLRTARPIR